MIMHCPPPSLSLPQLNNDWYQGDEEEEVGKREGEEALITLPPPSLRKPCTDVSPAHVETTSGFHPLSERGSSLKGRD